MNYLYLLLSQDKQKFKIGIAKDVARRYQNLKALWGDFDLGESYQISCQDYDPLCLEKGLHKLFHPFQVKIDDYKEGYTEFFSISCFNSVLEVIKLVNESCEGKFLDIKKGIEEPEFEPKKTNPWFQLSKEERRRITEKRRKEKIATCKRENINSLNEMIRELKKVVPYIVQRGVMLDQSHFVDAFGFKDEREAVILKSNDSSRELAKNIRNFSCLTFPNGGFNIIASLAGDRSFIYLYPCPMHYFEGFSEDFSHEEIIKKGMEISEILALKDSESMKFKIGEIACLN